MESPNFYESRLKFNLPVRLRCYIDALLFRGFHITLTTTGRFNIQTYHSQQIEALSYPILCLLAFSRQTSNLPSICGRLVTTTNDPQHLPGLSIPGGSLFKPTINFVSGNIRGISVVAEYGVSGLQPSRVSHPVAR